MVRKKRLEIILEYRTILKQGWQLKTHPKKHLEKHLSVGLIGFFNCNKTCLHTASQDLQNSPSTQVKLFISCRITRPMKPTTFNAPEIMNHLHLSSIILVIVLF